MASLKKSFPELVYLNGDWLAHDKAFVSVFDRGYMLGDGIYEVIPVYNGQPFAVEGHMLRFQAGLDAVGIGFDVDDLRPLLRQCLERSSLHGSDAAIYIQVTRGVAPRTHFFPEDVKPSVLLYAYPITLRGFENKLASVMISEDIRWHRCDIKSISLMANVRANNEAHRQSLAENLLSREGYITEGSHTSVFFVKNNTVYTHPEGHHILPGITRRVVIDLCGDLGLKLKEEAVQSDEVRNVDEIFLTGTTVQITAVTSVHLDGNEVFRTQDAGPITKMLQTAFIGKVAAET
ncbi:D-alanine transaminase [Arcticibacter pallidicorallinus]|uniref:D-alanine transaminase n=1 Tax=Arcticibacter pallidicorallinus TaxID=1259464 RepID=A0A2T0U3V7_9SPHI|nr:aminotransferase class IV [Arcticibacter pallidicorallinus]PRY52581.1 D-alanine transaminase [Arcticibacter pallidicorallinus]